MEKILIFHHVKHEQARRYADLADNEGVEYDIIDFWKPWKKPDLRKYSRLIIMGGPQSVYENFDSKEFEIETIKHFTGSKKPVLGCCLGSQLIASCFGAKVYPNVVKGRKFKETGFYKTLLTKKGESDNIFKGFAREFDVFHWHGDIFDLPEDSELLATGDFVKNQAFKIKGTKTYGMLFHFDFLPQMVKEMVRLDNKWLHADNKVDEKGMIRKAYELEPKIKEHSRLFFKNWMRL